MLRAFPAVVIENLSPLVDGGRYPIKRVVGEDIGVEADVFKDGHDVVAAVLKWRVVGQERWHETPMTHVDNDRWRGVFTIYEMAIHDYTVEAWTDSFRGWRHEFSTKFTAGIANLTSEALEGAGAERLTSPEGLFDDHDLAANNRRNRLLEHLKRVTVRVCCRRALGATSETRRVGLGAFGPGQRYAVISRSELAAVRLRQRYRLDVAHHARQGDENGDDLRWLRLD